MKKVFNISVIVLLLIVLGATLVYIKLEPIQVYKHDPPYSGSNNFEWVHSEKDTSKKTVLIMADNHMTELFDFLSPYFIFNETGNANVYISAQNNAPLTTQNSQFVLPALTYKEIDSLNIKPDMIVIPFMHSPENAQNTSWLRKHYSDSVIILSVCDNGSPAVIEKLFGRETMLRVSEKVNYPSSRLHLNHVSIPVG